MVSPAQAQVSTPSGLNKLSLTLGLSPLPTRLKELSPLESNSILQFNSLNTQNLSFPSPDQPPRLKVHPNQPRLSAGGMISL